MILPTVSEESSGGQGGKNPINEDKSSDSGEDEGFSNQFNQKCQMF